MNPSGNIAFIPKRGLARNIVVLFFACGFIPLFVLGLAFFSLYFDGQKHSIGRMQKEIAERLSLGISSYVERSTAQLRLFAGLLDLEKDAEAPARLASALLEEWMEYDTVIVRNLEGREFCNVSRYQSFSGPETGDQPNEPVYRDAPEGITHIGPVEISEHGKSPHIRIRVPFMSAKGDPSGVLEAEVNISKVWEIISKYSIGEDRYAYVVDLGGNLIAFREIPSAPHETDLGNIRGVRMCLEGNNEAIEYEGLTGVKVIGASARIPLTGWGVLVEQPVNDAYAGLYLLSGIFLAFFVIIAALAVFLVFKFSFKHVVRPVRRLREEAAMIAKGDLTRRIELERPDELGGLAESLNTMVGDLQKTLVSRDLLAKEVEERRRTEDALRKEEERLRDSEEKYRDLIENISEVIYSLDENGTVTYVSPVAESHSGYKQGDIIGRPFLDLIHGEDRSEAMDHFRNIRERCASDVEFRVVTRSGDPQWMRASVRAIFKDGRFAGARGALTNVSKMKRLEGELRQAQKMEALGTMAGGIAHDFNNILGIIVGNAEVAMLDIPETKAAYKNLEEVRAACLRARDVVREILSFSRRSEPVRKPVSLGSLVKGSMGLLRSSIPKNIEIHPQIPMDGDAVLADPSQVNQVLLNLCTNAAYAMREKGGVLEIILAAKEAGENTINNLPDLKPGEYVQMIIKDSGPGIEPAIMDRIFDPYFTTKPVGEGTGLGLSVVHGIVSSHGGAIHVDSKPGKGTAFHVFLPKTNGKPRVQRGKQEILPAGRERILFIDDEKMIVHSFQSMLEKLGYRVTGKSSSVEALEIFRSAPEQFDLIITDQTMPQMTGTALANAIMAARVDIPIILCTGYSDLISEEKARSIGIRAYAVKPVMIKELAKMIRGVLDRRGAARMMNDE